MARIVVITHEYDELLKRRGMLRRWTSSYMLYDIVGELQRRKHEVVVARGLSSRPTGHAALLHVDATVTPDDYVDYGRSFPLCLNVAAADISKRKVSGAVLDANDGWNGPVIVKSNRNSAGDPERRMNRLARRAGQAEPFPEIPEIGEYRIYDTPGEIPDGVTADPNRSVERFVAEREPDGFALRFWVFCGEAERCTRYVSSHRLVKAARFIRKEAVPVPDELRQRRRQLGFDYGKFDFVVHEGKAILLDANKTPGRPQNLTNLLAEGSANLADGFEGMLLQHGL
ncbi:hypothetical protein [Mesorhizobium sp.]|uniref:hypothetical protein n=1 Tax=Mesorhizobium sp. TaxID=1871066 RepID=UPI000FE87EC5|nr:hypothetical protein [Mesorhizobium sp.]RWO80996.1 MAG: hypothetical protein EOQ95_28595 [Mesorhizobium sp.]RWQ53897.1 MAG: hypothetical protein EOS84_14015 [Mesorhizobium sp.]